MSAGASGDGMDSPYLWLWDEGEERPLSSTEELDRLLDAELTQAAAGLAKFMELVRPPGGTLSIVLAPDLCHLEFESTSGDPPHYWSLGDEGAEGTLAFTMGHTERHTVARRHCVPTPVARQAIRDFFETGLLSERVRWIELER